MPALQDSIDAIRIAAAAADRMKATDIVAFDVTEPLAITDAMLIASASNERQVLAVAEEIEKDLYLKAGKRQPRSREGLTEGQWVLLDYGDFVIHVMHQESREYYRLERLWKDCPSIDLLGHCGSNTPRTSRSRRLPAKRDFSSIIETCLPENHAEGTFWYAPSQQSEYDGRQAINRKDNRQIGERHAQKRRTRP